MTITPTATATATLSRALDQAGDVIAAVHADQLDQPTPCPDWDVARLVGHLVYTPRNFLTMMQGDDVDWSATPQVELVEAAPLFRSAADDLIHAWHQAGENAEPGRLDWQTAEFAVHTWDLARATGQTRHLDEEVAKRGLDFMSGALRPEMRGEAFGDEVTVAEDAPAYDRLVGFAGRDPAWTA